MEVRQLQQFLLPRREPAFACLCLTLGAVPITTGVVRDGRVIAVGTEINVAAERHSAATFHGTQNFSLLKAEPVLILLDGTIAARANEIGHLDGGAAHSGLCSRRESGTLRVITP
jgi:hypothetical protein